MANTITAGKSSLDYMVQQNADTVLLAVPTPQFNMRLFADMMSMPRNSGSIMRMRRYNALPTSKTPIASGDPDPGYTPLSAVDIDAKISFYGQISRIDNQVTLQYQEDVLGQLATRLGVSLRQTEDELTRDALRSTASVLNAVHGVNGDNPTEPTTDDADEVTQALMNVDAMMMLDGKKGANEFGTAPRRDSFPMLAHTELIRSLEGMDDFVHKSAYPGGGADVPQTEWGQVHNLRVFLSSIGSVDRNASGNGNDVYNCFVPGMESYGCIEQDGASARFIYNSPEVLGGLRRRAEVGWFMSDVTKIKNDLWVLNFRVTRRAA